MQINSNDRPRLGVMAQAFIRFFKIAATDRKSLVTITVMFLIGVALAPVAPLFIAKLIEVLIDQPDNALTLAIVLIIGAAVVNFGAGAIEALAYYFAELYALARFRELSKRVIPMIADPNRSEREKADIRTAFTDLRQAIEDVVIVSFEFVVTIVVKVVAMSTILAVSFGFKYTAIMLIASIAIVGANVLNFVSLNRLLRARASTNYRLQTSANTLVENHELIALYQRIPYETQRFGRLAERIVRVNAMYFKTFFRYGATRELTTDLVTAVMTIIVALDVIAGRVGVEALYLFLAYAVALIADIQGAPRFTLSVYDDLVKIEPILTAIEAYPDETPPVAAYRNVQRLTVANVQIPYLPNFPSDQEFSFDRGNIYWIDGANGAGKTSFLRGLIGVAPEISCDVFVTVDSETKGPLAIPERMVTIGFAAQTERIWPRSVLHNLRYSKDDPTAAISPNLPLPSAVPLLKNANALSGGQRQLVHTLRALEKDVDIVILDEPTNALDGERIVDLIEYIKSIAWDKIVIFASHDRLFQEIATHRVMLTAERDQQGRQTGIKPNDLRVG